MKVIIDLEKPKRCYDCQFLDNEFEFCHLDKDSTHADRACDLVGDTERAEKGDCPIKPNGYLAEAAQMVLDFIEKCEYRAPYLITPNGDKISTDWRYVEWGCIEDWLEEIIKWAERRENNGIHE